METSLHRQLKSHYARDPASVEVTVDGFRIDAISEADELIEVQHASLGALRDKTRKLLDNTDHALRIVKPIIAKKKLTTLTKRQGKIKRERFSPKQADILDLFEDLVHFTSVFPRERLTLEVALITSQEFRVDRKSTGWRKKKYTCLDQELVEILETTRLCTVDDLLGLLPTSALPAPFDTAELGAAIDRPRWFAQKVAYCLRQTGAAKMVGKRGNSQLYKLARKAKTSRRNPKKSVAVAKRKPSSSKKDSGKLGKTAAA